MELVNGVPKHGTNKLAHAQNQELLAQAKNAVPTPTLAHCAAAAATFTVTTA